MNNPVWYLFSNYGVVHFSSLIWVCKLPIGSNTGLRRIISEISRGEFGGNYLYTLDGEVNAFHVIEFEFHGRPHLCSRSTASC